MLELHGPPTSLVVSQFLPPWRHGIADVLTDLMAAQLAGSRSRTHLAGGELPHRALVRSYKLLLTRGLRGVYLHSTDARTQAFPDALVN